MTIVHFRRKLRRVERVLNEKYCMVSYRRHNARRCEQTSSLERPKKILPVSRPVIEFICDL